MCAYGSLPLLRTLPSSGIPTKKTLFPSIHTHHNHGKHRRQHEWRCLRPGSCRLLQGSRQHPTLTLRKYHGHVSVFTDRRCWRQFPLPPHMTLNDLTLKKLFVGQNGLVALRPWQDGWSSVKQFSIAITMIDRHSARINFHRRKSTLSNPGVKF